MTSLVSKKDHAVEGSVGKTVAQPGFIQDDKLLSKYLIKVLNVKDSRWRSHSGFTVLSYSSICQVGATTY